MSSSVVQQVPHPWSKASLFAKAQLYAEQMNVLTHDDWKFVLWSTLMLELLARAAVSSVSTTLLADSKDTSNSLYALGIEPKAQKFVPKSIEISGVIRVLQEVNTDFSPELAGFALNHMVRRNEELHSGSSSLGSLASSEGFPAFTGRVTSC